MPPVNWGVFEKLPGSTRSNFEMLCRALIRRNYGRYGHFAALANQPGVEFHLHLHTACTLGNPGRWFGWQCRWYDLPSGKALGSTRRRKIEQAISTTERMLTGLTDWVLWTRHPLTRGDQDWFHGLKTQMQLYLWTSVEVEEHLSGEAEILRATYFGELVLTPEELAKLHKVAVAAIRGRWQPDVHQTVDAERALRRMLGETEKWHDLRRLASQLEIDTADVDRDVSDITGLLADATAEMASLARESAAALSAAYAALERGDLDLLRQQLSNRPAAPSQKLAGLPRQLRAGRVRAALTATNALADIRRAGRLLDEVDTYLGKRIISIKAEAGCGKTQLAAQLTEAVGDRPAGLLLYGKDLHGGQSLDDLARHVTIHGNPVPSMEALIAAVDAAGQRTNRRLPIVVDGLNEAEDPRDWKGGLASLNEILRWYPYVFVVCTLRPAFIDEALPPDIGQLEIPDFGHDTREAVKRYFIHYRINPADAELPVELLKHPLILRLFCEVTNPTRKREVGIEAMPGSLSSLFDLYLKQAAKRIAELAPRTRRYYEQDVRIALDEIGVALWELRSRGLDEGDLRQRLSDDARPWNESIVRALEQEGVVLRNQGETAGAIIVTAIFDPLAGHLVADAVLGRHGRSGLGNWLKNPATATALAGPLSEQHPLARDVLRGLVGLVPRRLHRQQLWPLLDEPLRTSALLETTNLEGAYLDAQTVEELAKVAVKPEVESRALLYRLWQTRGAPDHPLNAEFLDTILRSMPMAVRDVWWTEWIRHNSGEFLADIQWQEKLWRNRAERSAGDRLRALWVMWSLTSTVRQLRDQATRALYWFGRSAPVVLFGLTTDALPINDPYVPERMLAAAYGTTMALHADYSNGEFVDKALSSFVLGLYEHMFAERAPHSTTHALMRDFARHTITIALLHMPKLLNSRQRKRVVPPFHEGGIREWGVEKDRDEEKYRHGNAPIQMDFENYTIGNLVPERHNYQHDHKGYQQALGNIYWRCYNLGYSLEAFGEIDKDIASLRWRGRMAENSGRVDRYGKKYSWIAYYELYGLHYDKGLLKTEYSNQEERPTDVDIDPSFPDEPENVQIITENWLGDRKQSLSSWIERGETPSPLPYLLVEKVNGVEGPWVLLDGFITQFDELRRRAIFALPRGFFVSKRYSCEIRRILEKHGICKPRLPEIPEDYYTFAGEIPWCETFPNNGLMDLEVHVGHRQKKVAREEIRFYRQGRKVNERETVELLRKLQLAGNEEDQNNAMLELLKAEQVTCRKARKWFVSKESISKGMPVLIPVRENNWESYHSGVNPGRNTIVPAREIAEELGLSLCLPSWNMYDSNRKLASVSIKWGDLWLAGHNLCYLRRDVLDQFLSRSGLDFVWVFWGERKIRLPTAEYRRQNRKFECWYKEFRRIYWYKEGKIIPARPGKRRKNRLGLS